MSHFMKLIRSTQRDITGIEVPDHVKPDDFYFLILQMPVGEQNR